MRQHLLKPGSVSAQLIEVEHTHISASRRAAALRIHRQAPAPCDPPRSSSAADRSAYYYLPLCSPNKPLKWTIADVSRALACVDADSTKVLVLYTVLDLNQKLVSAFALGLQQNMCLLNRADSAHALAPTPPPPELARNMEPAAQLLPVTPALLSRHTDDAAGRGDMTPLMNSISLKF